MTRISLLIPLRMIVIDGLLASSGTCALADPMIDSAAVEATPANCNMVRRDEIMVSLPLVSLKNRSIPFRGVLYRRRVPVVRDKLR